MSRLGRRDVVVFDARYINDAYHGVGRHAFGLIDALTGLDSSRDYVIVHNPSSANSRFNLTDLAHRENTTLRPWRAPLHTIEEQLGWPRLLAAAGATLFHSPYVSVPLLGRIPVLMTVHDLILERYPEYAPSRFLRAKYRLATRAALRRASAVLTVSGATKADLLRHYGIESGKVWIIGNGVSAAFQEPLEAGDAMRTRDRYGLPPQFVLALGAIRPHKGLVTVLEAYSARDMEDAPPLVVAGSLDRRHGDHVLRQLAELERQGRAKWIGVVAEGDLKALYSLATVFVFPSLVEGFGLPALEAMACGTPVAVAASSSLPEVVGDAGAFFRPGDADNLARVLGRLLNNAAQRALLGDRGRDRATSFTWENVARATLVAYEAATAAKFAR